MPAKPNSNPSSPPPSLLSPFQTLALNTPTSTSSLTFLPTPKHPLGAPKSIEAMDNMPPSDADAPPADIHTKVQETPARFSSAKAIHHFKAALRASKMLQQVLSEREPEPYSLPVALSDDLVNKMETWDWNQAVRHLYGTSTGLDDIQEEEEKTSEQEEVDAVQGMTKQLRKVHFDTNLRTASDCRLGTSDTVVGGSEADGGNEQSGAFDSTATLVEGQFLGSGSSPGLLSAFTASMPVQTVAAQSGTTTQRLHHSYAAAQSATTLQRMSSPGLLPDHNPIEEYGDDKENTGTVRRSANAPTFLFPSPTVGSNSTWELEQNGETILAAHASAPARRVSLPTARHRFPSNLNILTEEQETSEVPQITVQAPSPSKRIKSKKRGASSRDNIFGPPLTRQRSDSNRTGLPILPPHLEALWKIPFLGNTPSLLTILLHWSVTMKRIHGRLPDQYLFASNPAFPYPINPPVSRSLMSAAFYDTSVTPHKEIRFIGPGDVGTLSYNEVDVFMDPEQSEEEPIHRENGRTFNGLKSAFSMPSDDDVGHDKSNVRWAYLVLQAKRDPMASTEAAPHMLIAWHIDAVTGKSKCLHTIYPDSSKTATSSPRSTTQKAPPKAGCFSSAKDLLRDPLRFHRAIREASTAPAAAKTVGQQEDFKEKEGALTLEREVLMLGKAGRIPLIEGWRVDIGKWRDWLDAVGRGTGKVVIWGERGF